MPRRAQLVGAISCAGEGVSKAVDVVCDQPQMIAITNYLGVGVEINTTGPKGNLEIIKLPEDASFDKFRAKLLYVPGHYDALYV